MPQPNRSKLALPRSTSACIPRICTAPVFGTLNEQSFLEVCIGEVLIKGVAIPHHKRRRVRIWRIFPTPLLDGLYASLRLTNGSNL